MGSLSVSRDRPKWVPCQAVFHEISAQILKKGCPSSAHFPRGSAGMRFAEMPRPLAPFWDKPTTLNRCNRQGQFVVVRHAARYTPSNRPERKRDSRATAICAGRNHGRCCRSSCCGLTQSETKARTTAGPSTPLRLRFDSASTPLRLRFAPLRMTALWRQDPLVVDRPPFAGLSSSPP